MHLTVMPGYFSDAVQLSYLTKHHPSHAVAVAMLRVYLVREQPCPAVSLDSQRLEPILSLFHSPGILDDASRICCIQEDPGHILYDEVGTFYNLLRG